MTVLDYAMMVEDTHVNTKLVEYRLKGDDLPVNRYGEGPLIGVSLTDILADGNLSMDIHIPSTSRKWRNAASAR